MSGMEHKPPGHDPGLCERRLRNLHRGREHGIPLLRHVEDHLRLAHRRHGPLLHQLPALRRPENLVRTRTPRPISRDLPP